MRTKLSLTLSALFGGCVLLTPAYASEEALQRQIDALAEQLKSLQSQLNQERQERAAAAAAAPVATQAATSDRDEIGRFKLNISGTLDGGLAYQSDISPPSASNRGGTTKFFNAGLIPTNLAFTGETRLSETTKVLFKLDTEMLTSTGANFLALSGQTAPNAYNGPAGNPVLFNRAAYVGLDGPLGTLTVGRQQTVAVDGVARVEPMNFVDFFQSSAYGAFGVGNAVFGQAPINTAKYTPGVATNMDSRDNALIKYTMPTYRGLKLIGGFSPGGVAGDTADGSKGAIAANFDYKGFSAGGSYTEWRPVDVVSAEASTYRHGNFGVGYRWGDYSVRAALGTAVLPEVTLKDSSDNNIAYTAGHVTIYGLGGTWVATPKVDLFAGYYVKRYHIEGTSPRVDTIGVGGTYALYKQVKLYALYDNARSMGSNDAYQTLGGHDNANAFAVGLAYSFSADVF